MSGRVRGTAPERLLHLRHLRCTKSVKLMNPMKKNVVSTGLHLDLNKNTKIHNLYKLFDFINM